MTFGKLRLSGYDLTCSDKLKFYPDMFVVELALL